MSHFSVIPIKVTTKDLIDITPIFEQVAATYHLKLAKNQIVKNDWGSSAFMMVGLLPSQEAKIQPIGLQPSEQGELLLVSDFMVDHHSPTKDVTQDVFKELTQALKDFRRKKAESLAKQWASENTEYRVQVKLK
jgi:hypothetical protein